MGFEKELAPSVSNNTISWSQKGRARMYEDTLLQEDDGSIDHRALL